jgi:dihydrofolate reductase
MRRLRYQVVASLDGFIAGPNGEYDWILPDPTVDFSAVYRRFDVALMGRRTFEAAQKGPGARLPGMQTVVCSRTLKPAEFPQFTITADAAAAVMELKAQPGKDIWLFGGGRLFRTLMDAGLVDEIEVGVMPVLLGEGIPLLPGPGRPAPLRLSSCERKPNGSVWMSYAPGRPGD